MRVSCGRNQFGLNANHRNSTSMRIVIRIRVDRPLDRLSVSGVEI